MVTCIHVCIIFTISHKDQRLTDTGAECTQAAEGGGTAVTAEYRRGLGATRGAVGGVFCCSGFLRSSHDV